jgi:hypothetical protein
MVMAEGPSAIFKISLALLRIFKSKMMELDGFEQVADFIKNHMNILDDAKTKEVLNIASKIDLGQLFFMKLFFGDKTFS